MLPPVRASRLISALALTSLFIPRAALADGEDLGVSWAQCVVAPAKDADRDGVDDACEYAIAARFQPQMVFSQTETASARLPFWASKPAGYRALRIFYALSYYKDAGDPDLFGAYGHDGDSEFIVLEVVNTAGTTWELESGYLSAHYGATCNSGKWYTADKFEYAGAYAGQPVVYSAEQKHANYPTLADCDNGGCYADYCTDAQREDVGIAAARDLGLRGQPLIDEWDVGGNPEWFWTDTVFCGWTRPPGDARDKCVPAANSYAKQLVAFEMAFGPVGDARLCEPCVEDTDCADGGVCMFVGTDRVCGRECDGLPCPAGSHCDAVATGESQCLPDSACSCVLACVGKQCGSDGCGGTCGECDAGETCDATFACVPACVPSCTGRACGADDGCGSPCNDACNTGGGGSGGTTGTGGAAPTGGAGGTGGESGSKAGCGCRTAGGEGGGFGAALALAAVALARSRRRAR